MSPSSSMPVNPTQVQSISVRPLTVRNQLLCDEPIAIVGSGCIAGALSVSEFDKMLSEGRSAIQAVLPNAGSEQRLMRLVKGRGTRWQVWAVLLRVLHMIGDDVRFLQADSSSKPAAVYAP